MLRNYEYPHLNQVQAVLHQQGLLSPCSSLLPYCCHLCMQPQQLHLHPQVEVVLEVEEVVLLVSTCTLWYPTGQSSKLMNPLQTIGWMSDEVTLYE